MMLNSISKNEIPTKPKATTMQPTIFNEDRVVKIMWKT